jgi:CRISPR-associated protein Cas2
MRPINLLRRGGEVFVIVTYDVKEKRINKVRKKLNQYLFWSQNSVFEGEITESQLIKCLSEIKKIINIEEDSIYIYKIENFKNFEKVIVGVKKNFDTFVL